MSCKRVRRAQVTRCTQIGELLVIMNKVMEPFWIAAQGWESLKLPIALQELVAARLPTLTDKPEDVDHIHVREFGIRENFLGYGVRFASELVKIFRNTNRDQRLLVYISLDDGSGLIDSPSEEVIIWQGGGVFVDGEEWFECTVHFHVEWDSYIQWADADDAEGFAQPVLFLNSDDDAALFCEND